MASGEHPEEACEASVVALAAAAVSAAGVVSVVPMVVATSIRTSTRTTMALTVNPQVPVSERPTHQLDLPTVVALVVALAVLVTQNLNQVSRSWFAT